MPISVVCSHCQRKLKVADAAAGKRARCPLCKAVITVPQAEEFVEPDEMVEPVKESAVSKPKEAPKKKAAWDEDDDDKSSKKSGNPDDSGEYGFSEPAPKKKKKRRYDDYDDDEDEDDEEEEERRERKRRRRRRVATYGGRSSGASSHRGTLIFVLAILGLVFSCIPILAWIFGGIALNMANTDLALMDTRAMDRSGEGMTKTGKGIAILAVGLGFLFFIVNIWFMVTQKGGHRF